MKKIGIAAISTMLFLAVSCSKNNIAPQPGYGSSDERINVRNDPPRTYTYTAKLHTNSDPVETGETTLNHQGNGK
jgi:hypothetical protein